MKIRRYEESLMMTLYIGDFRNKKNIYGKKKNGKGSGNPVLDALTDMLGAMSPEERMQLMANLENFASSGRSLGNMQESVYTYQHPDYTQQVKPLAEYLQHLLKAFMPSEILAAYEVAHKAMTSLSQQEQEDAMRNFFMFILADGLTHDFDEDVETSGLPIIAGFQLVDDFKLTGLFDVILETLKQNKSFYEFYYSGYEEVSTLILAHVGVEHLEELKEMMKTDGFMPEVYPTVFNAVVQMAVENPSCRLQVLIWVTDVLKSCIDFTMPAMAMDWIVKSLAQIKAVELLPMIKNIYKDYRVPPVEIENGIKGVTKLLTEGTFERIIMFADFKEVLNEFAEGEANDFNDDLFGFDNWSDDDDWLDDEEDDDERDADALFYKECGLKPAKSKSGKSKSESDKSKLKPTKSNSKSARKSK